MAVRPATHARDPERRKAGTPPRLNIQPWPRPEVGSDLRRRIAADGRKEQGAKTLRRLSGE